MDELAKKSKAWLEKKGKKIDPKKIIEKKKRKINEK